MKRFILLLSVLLSLNSCQDFLDETPKGTLIPETVNDFGMILDNYSYDNYIAYGQCLTLIMSDDFTIPAERNQSQQCW